MVSCSSDKPLISALDVQYLMEESGVKKLEAWTKVCWIIACVTFYLVSNASSVRLLLGRSSRPTPPHCTPARDLSGTP